MTTAPAQLFHRSLSPSSAREGRQVSACAGVGPTRPATVRPDRLGGDWALTMSPAEKRLCGQPGLADSVLPGSSVALTKDRTDPG